MVALFGEVLGVALLEEVHSWGWTPPPMDGNVTSQLPVLAIMPFLPFAMHFPLWWLLAFWNHQSE